MPLIAIAVLLGLFLGVLVVGILAFYFVFSRPYRRIRSFVALAFGYILIGTLTCGSIWLLFKFEEHFQIQPKSSGHYEVFYAFAFSLFIGMIFIIRSEAQWRKAVGLDDKSVRAAKTKSVGVGLVIFASYTAFQAGVGTVILLGPRLFGGISFGLALYSTVCSFMCTVWCGYILIKTVCKRENDKR